MHLLNGGAPVIKREINGRGIARPRALRRLFARIINVLFGLDSPLMCLQPLPDGLLLGFIDRRRAIFEQLFDSGDDFMLGVPFAKQRLFANRAS